MSRMKTSNYKSSLGITSTDTYLNIHQRSTPTFNTNVQHYSQHYYCPVCPRWEGQTIRVQWAHINNMNVSKTINACRNAVCLTKKLSMKLSGTVQDTRTPAQSGTKTTWTYLKPSTCKLTACCPSGRAEMPRAYPKSYDLIYPGHPGHPGHFTVKPKETKRASR